MPYQIYNLQKNTNTICFMTKNLNSNRFVVINAYAQWDRHTNKYWDY